jgi:hypothetical protein
MGRPAHWLHLVTLRRTGARIICASKAEVRPKHRKSHPERYSGSRRGISKEKKRRDQIRKWKE